MILRGRKIGLLQYKLFICKICWLLKIPLYNYFENSAGNRNSYQPETFSFVVQSYKEIDQVVKDKYNTFSDYAIERKLNQFEKCIKEIFLRENSNKQCKQYIYKVLQDDYFQKYYLLSGRQ